MTCDFDSGGGSASSSACGERGAMAARTAGRVARAALLPRAIGIAAMLLTVALGGCSASIADLPLIGVPSDAPKRPEQSGAYPNVHEKPGAREDQVLGAADQDRIRNELKAARDKQKAQAAADAAAIAAQR
jgi:hypothetical protein